MKILLDENIDVRFKYSLSAGHEVYTVKDMNWNGIKNGDLLLLLKEHTFDVWIVVDKNIPYQQNLSNLPCLIIVLDVYRNTLKHLLPLVPDIIAVLTSDISKKVVVLSKE
ncbi:MAG: DUF5615 family PIN-like protein [Flavisolibacter sp.]|nr:DUF5615 family PIN-like protein [Flavisolibacter sp.]MBD0286295.1 DUF5615 family PIN-like protein [Flavisolibacter sp.]MBD0369199.1 DUF5615 family PIN-like protein [Flavisolibacter sp.]